jgi:phage FluMu protein Com
MAELKIKCPRCRHIIGTGVSMTIKEFCRAPLTNREVECEKCKRIIRWNKEDILAISFYLQLY